MPLLEDAYERRARRPDAAAADPRGCCGWPPRWARCRASTSSTTTSRTRSCASCTAKPTTRAEDILGWVPGYWEHYVEQAAQRRARARPGPLARRHPRARAGDRLHGRRLQRPRRDAAGQRAQPGLGPGLPDTLVVETLGRCDAEGIRPLADAGAAGAPARARRGARRATSRRPPTPPGRATRATPSGRSPRIRSCGRSTWPSSSTREMAAAHRAHLPARLLPA